MQTSENAYVVLPSSYRHNEVFLNAVSPNQDEQSNKDASRSSNSRVVNSEQSRDANAAACQTMLSVESEQQSLLSRRSSEDLEGTQNTDDQSVSLAPDELSVLESVDSSIFFYPNVEFSTTKARSFCALVSVAGMPYVLTPDERIAYLSHVFGDDTNFIRVVGGLLSFIVKNGMLSRSSRNDDIIDINAISYRNYCGVMKISPVTLRALHVFSDDIHPVGRGGMAGKEGMSLYGLLKVHIKTHSAKLLLRSWLVYPSTDKTIIQGRQFLVGCLLDSANRSLTVALRHALVGLKDVRCVIARIRRMKAGLAEWKGLYGCARSFVAVLEALKVAVQQRGSLNQSALVKKVLSVCEQDLREVVNWIDAIVDFEESAATGRLIVATGFSEEIDDLKRSYNGMDDFLTAISSQELKKIVDTEGGPSITGLKVVYVPQVGFLVVLGEEDVDEAGVAIWEQQGLSFVFHSKEGGYHFRNERCRSLDDEIGDIHGAILDLESKAFRYLEKQVFMYCQSLCTIGDAVCELDCLQGLAACSKEYSWTLPTICDDGRGELSIEDGRHALLENKVAAFVPNSSHIKIGDVHVLTG